MAERGGCGVREEGKLIMLMRHAVMPYNWDVKVAATGHNGKVIDVWKRRGTFRMATLAMSVPRLCLFRRARLTGDIFYLARPLAFITPTIKYLTNLRTNLT